MSKTFKQIHDSGHQAAKASGNFLFPDFLSQVREWSLPSYHAFASKLFSLDGRGAGGHRCVVSSLPGRRHL